MGDIGLEGMWRLRVASVLLSLAFVAGAVVFYWLLNAVVNPVIKKVTHRTPTRIDNILMRDKFLQWCWWLMSAMLLRWLLPYALSPFKWVESWMEITMNIVVIGFGTKALVEFVKGFFLVVFDTDRVEEEAERLMIAEENGEDYEYTPTHSLNGLKQMICILIWIVGVILMVSVAVGKNPVIIVSGLGAGAAVLMLVFKDSILGVVAGVQLNFNDMLRPGDWISAPAYGANGRVQEVTLATVKVKNWDHTTVTIPPYELISKSFQNYRRMEETGGRRVMRSINIDMTTVRFLTREERMECESEPWAQGLPQEGEWVNLTVFRHYLKHYISTLPTLKKRMLYMVRELQPTAEGLPIEIYFFTSKTSWEAYELVQAEALDHILAVVTRFGLRLFQKPTGEDLRKMGVSLLKIENAAKKWE